MPQVNIKQTMIVEIKNYLHELGVETSGKKPATLVESFITLVLYDDPNPTTARASAKDLSVTPQEAIAKGKIREWASKSPVLKYGPGEEPTPKKIKEVLVTSLREVEQEYEPPIKELLIEEVVEKEEPITPTNVAPWEDLRRMPMAKIKKEYKGHPVLKWCNGDKVKEHAAECVFANVTHVVRSSEAVIQTCEQLYRTFITYKNLLENGGKDARNNQEPFTNPLSTKGP